MITDYPVELVAAIEVKGLFGSHKAAVAVPFYPTKRISSTSFNNCTWVFHQDSEFSGTIPQVHSATARHSMSGADYKVTYSAAIDRLKVSVRPLFPLGNNATGDSANPRWTLMQLAATISVNDDESGTDQSIFKVTHGSNDGRPYTGRSFQLDSSLGAGWYSHEIDLANVPAENWVATDLRNWSNEGSWSTIGYRCKPINFGLFFVVNIREDKAANLERFFGLTSMTKPNSWETFDWSWDNRLKLEIGSSP